MRSVSLLLTVGSGCDVCCCVEVAMAVLKDECGVRVAFSSRSDEVQALRAAWRSSRCSA